MEMHTPESLRAIHGLDIRPRRRSSFRRCFAGLVKDVRDANRKRRAYKRLNAMMGRNQRERELAHTDVTAAGRRR